MRRNVHLMLLFGWLIFGSGNLMAINDCEADTSFFYLPQNEFNTTRPWYFKPQDGQEQWLGGVNYYNMYDPCIAKNSTLVFTEINNSAGNAGTYVEITNIGTTAIDLSEYRIIAHRNASSYPSLRIDRMSHLDLSGILAPGKSYVAMGFNMYLNQEKGVMDRSDSIAEHNKLLAQIANLTYPVTKTESPVPYLVGRGVDIIHSSKNYNYSLAKVIGDTLEAVVDVFGQIYVEGGTSTIAGDPDALINNTIVRKQFIGSRTYGNTDFIISQGSEAAVASEWIVLPKFRNATTHLPTTIGSHNPNSAYTLTAKENSGVTIDEANGKIIFPWGVYRGDSVMSYLNAGPDMAWAYKTNGIIEDEVSNLIRQNDTITFYHCGTDVTIKHYQIEVNAPTADVAKAACLNRTSDLDRMYNETNSLTIDTIYGRRLYFDYPVDTLLKYVETAPNASISIVWKDGDDPRPTLKDGDMLQITSQSGQTHHYYIALIPYDTNILSHDARLRAITWPDYPMDELDEYIWTTGDTIPGYNKDAFNYLINLPAGTQRIPVLKAQVFNPRAKMVSIPAKNLYGSIEDQTTKFMVSAEDDTTSLIYSVRFIVEQEDWSYDGTPFFSELSDNLSTSGMIFEIVNPGNTLLDMSDYLIAGGKYEWKNVQDILKWDPAKFIRNCRIYRPGFTYDSLQMATKLQYWFDPNGDANVDALLEPGGCFTIAATSHANKWGMVDQRTGKWSDKYANGVIEGPNVILHEVNADSTWAYNKYGGDDVGKLGRTLGTFYKENSYFLLKILNDSVKNGSKGAVDAIDFEVIDVIGKIEAGKSLGWLDPYTGAPIDAQVNDFYMQRKPEVYKGNAESMGSFGYANIETPADYDAQAPVLGDTTAFEWVYNLSRPSNFNIGTHTMNPVTEYKSNVASTKYLVTVGLSMNEEINAVNTNTSASAFLANIIKTDKDQLLALKTANGDSVGMLDIVQEGNVLTVTSANGANQTAYTIHVGELNSDVSLTSDEYEITNTEVKLPSIDNITIKELASNLTVNSKSQLYIVDKNNGLIAFTAFNYRDSVYYAPFVSNDLSAKVVAQNGDSKLYRIVLPTTSSEVYLTSHLLAIDNIQKQINGVENGINVEQLLQNISASTGATATVHNKWAQQKEFGIILFDDVVKVVSQDGTKTVYYGITINTEIEPEVTLAVTDKSVETSSLAYPNPTAGVVTFAKAFAKAEVIDITGKHIITEDAGTQIDLSPLTAGVYIITVSDKYYNQSTVKIIKQ